MTTDAVEINAGANGLLDTLSQVLAKAGRGVTFGLKAVYEGVVIFIGVPLTELLITLFAPQGKNRFYDTDQFPWIKDLEANWEVMRSELDGVLKLNEQDCLPSMGDFLPYQNQYTKTIKNWKVFVLQFFGHDIVENQALCPETVKLVTKIPNMTGVMFSVLNPHQHIYPHRGFLKGVLRLHIGLKVPKNYKLCTFRHDGKDVHWEEGKSFMFDQTYEHQVWNHSDDVRIVLLLDILRPLPFPLHQMNSWIVKTAETSFIGQRMSKVVERWTTKYPKDIERYVKKPQAAPTATVN